MESRSHFLVVSVFCGHTIGPIGVDTPHHIVQLGSGEYAWEGGRGGGGEGGGEGGRGGGRRKGRGEEGGGGEGGGEEGEEGREGGRSQRTKGKVSRGL